MSKKAAKAPKPGVTKTEPKYKVPQTLDEATQLLSVIGEKRRTLLQKSTAYDSRIEAIEKEAMEEMSPDIQDIDQAFTAIKAFAEARRNELTDNGKKKTVETATGTFGWKDTPPALVVADEEEVIKLIEALEDETLKESLLRRKTEINKDALKQKSEYALTLPGVKLEQNEIFRVKPKDDTSDLTQESIDKLLKAG